MHDPLLALVLFAALLILILLWLVLFLHPLLPTLLPWDRVKSPRGRKKTISTQGYACPNPDCDYDHRPAERIHARVAWGHHGKNERIQNYFCHACRHTLTPGGLE